jgi:DeoR/GlpR family transcriptional regulator of sugar metabolism
MTSLAADRQRAIIDAARQEGGVVISVIAGELGVSEMTVRRDLKELAAKGLVQRVHGGAVAAPEARFDDRLTRQSPAKQRAAHKLIPFIPTNGTIYLDGSTTMLHLVDHLREAEDLRVVTNHIETFQRLSSHAGVEPLLIGGKLDPRTDNLVGSLALRSLLAIAFDAAFFSAWGISPELGLMEVTLEDAEVKDLVSSRSMAVYVAVDHSKLGTTAAGAWRPDKAKTTLATDLPVDSMKLNPYQQHFGKLL